MKGVCHVPKGLRKNNFSICWAESVVEFWEEMVAIDLDLSLKFLGYTFFQGIVFSV